MQAGLLQTSTFDIQAEGQWSTEKGPFQQAIQGLLLTLCPKPPASIYLITQMCQILLDRLHIIKVYIILSFQHYKPGNYEHPCVSIFVRSDIFGSYMRCCYVFPYCPGKIISIYIPPHRFIL